MVLIASKTQRVSDFVPCPAVEWSGEGAPVIEPHGCTGSVATRGFFSTHASEPSPGLRTEWFIPGSTQYHVTPHRVGDNSWSW